MGRNSIISSSALPSIARTFGFCLLIGGHRSPLVGQAPSPLVLEMVTRELIDEHCDYALQVRSLAQMCWPLSELSWRVLQAQCQSFSSILPLL